LFHSFCVNKHNCPFGNVARFAKKCNFFNYEKIGNSAFKFNHLITLSTKTSFENSFTSLLKMIFLNFLFYENKLKYNKAISNTPIFPWRFCFQRYSKGQKKSRFKFVLRFFKCSISKT
jgi:hypothetical protein